MGEEEDDMLVSKEPQPTCLPGVQRPIRINQGGV
jgi:hypothetical protein